MYNTAVGKMKNNPVSGKDHNIYWNDNAFVFQHNIVSGKHELFDRADAIHSELAWTRGYDKFTKGTPAEDTTFSQYVEAIKRVVRELGIPTYLMCGKSMTRIMEPDWAMPSHFRYHGNIDSVYMVYNAPKREPFYNEDECMVWLSRNYNCVLDFCCGYGNLLNPIIIAKKRAILSDINLGCIHYIRDKYKMKEWKKNDS